MTILQIMALWTLTVALKAIEQIKEASTFVFDKHFKGKGVGVLGNTATIKIRKGAGVILHTIEPGADRLVKDSGDVYELTLKLPRFGRSDQITAHEINEFNSLDGEDKAEAVSAKIAQILKEHKDEYLTTIEYMCAGALFGKVIDGAGKVLFEFNTNAPKIEFKGKTTITSLNEIDDAIVKELGSERGYDVLASRLFLNNLSKDATTAGLFDQNEAKWINENDKRVLVVHGTKFIPYNPQYKDTDGNPKTHITNGEAVVIPHGEDIFGFVYGRADHTAALTKAPTLFFAAAPEELDRGKGWAIETETKPLPYCIRPGALIKLKYSN